MLYRHTQSGTLIRRLLGAVVVLELILAAALARAGTPAPVVIGLVLVALLLGFLGFLFHALTVEVTATAVSIHFGPGWVRRSIPLERVRNARVVHHPWYYGWGIRLTPHGWTWIVSGNRAVEIEMAGGKKFRVGSDEPEALRDAIQSARAET